MRFLIVGSGRCGSTLLRDILNLHPEVFVFAETHWIPKMYETYGSASAPVDALISIVERTRHVTGKPVTLFDRARLRAQLGERKTLDVAAFCDHLGQMFAGDQGKRYWADKTPDYGPYLEILQRLWPELKILHIVRHGADVACSMARHQGYRWLASANETWWCPVSFNRYYTAVRARRRPLAEFVSLWFRRVERIRDELGRLRPGSYLELRFEDLVATPRATIERAAGFVGFAPGGDWIEAAVALVNPDRIRSRAPAEVLDLFHGAPERLLTELGYLPPAD